MNEQCVSLQEYSLNLTPPEHHGLPVTDLSESEVAVEFSSPTELGQKLYPRKKKGNTFIDIFWFLQVPNSVLME